MPTEGGLKKGTKQRLSIRSRTHDAELRTPRMAEDESILPPEMRSRLWKLFRQIEGELEGMYEENIALQQKVDFLTEKLEVLQSGKTLGEGAASMIDGTDSSAKLSVKSKASSQLSQLILKPKAKGAGGKTVFSFKGTSSTGYRLMHHYIGHSDGVWEVSVSRGDAPLLATASADRTARLWCIETHSCVLQYMGHLGSVNSVRFHPSEPLLLTASGDNTAHVWKSNVSLPTIGQQPEIRSCPSSGDDIDGSDREDVDGQESENIIYVKTPQVQLEGHSSVLIAADWLAGGKQLVTASWDRTANLYDLETSAIVHALTGHDQELTHACAHPSQKMVVTSSMDTTFRLWDFRDPSIHSVNVFQGHTDSVTSAAFASGDKVVSGSDDRTVKVWDLKNMRTPLAMVRTDSPVNRLSISPTSNIMAIPQDNRNIRLYDLNGVRVGRLPRSNRQGHHRMVCCTAWNDESTTCNLFSCGFDRQVLGWHVGIIPG
ncbi:WD repeat-containing protein 37-like [Diadema antillarum]|uniref:WD repeat-containing protein 37-like n=1 Tax=Diadema antillarum TaxID=105358 RepID=UPI003A8B6543